MMSNITLPQRWIKPYMFGKNCLEKHGIYNHTYKNTQQSVHEWNAKIANKTQKKHTSEIFLETNKQF